MAGTRVRRGPVLLVLAAVLVVGGIVDHRARSASSATTVTTVASELYPVSVGGRIVGFLLMLYAIGIFSYFIGAIASVLVDSDARRTSESEKKDGIRLDRRERDTLRSILERAEDSSS